MSFRRSDSMTKKEKALKNKRDKAFNKMAKALGEYIETLGGTAIVLGGTGVWHELADLKFNCCIRFKITIKMPKSTVDQEDA